MNGHTAFTKTFRVLSVLAAVVLFVSCGTQKAVRFGIVTDLHYSQRNPSGVRYYSQTIEKLTEAIKVFNSSDLDFIIELGDLKDQDKEPERERTIAYLDEIESVFQSFDGPVYHVLGNHDMDGISKDDFLQHTSNNGNADGKTYYSFVFNHIKFIVLDANYNLDGIPYDKGNFDWKKAYIPKHQIDWLKKELKGNRKPVVIFIHQLLDSFSEIGKELCVSNAAEIVSVLEEDGHVLAVFQGHHHPGHYSCRNNIHYWTMKGMITGQMPDNNSFAVVEIDGHNNIVIDGFYNCEDRVLSGDRSE